MNNTELNKILVVEDEEDIRTIVKFSLEKKGQFNVKYCSSGPEALKEVESFMPDIIMLDMMMPGMDGIATLQALRKIPTLNDVPIIFMTAKVQTNEVEHYKEIGALDVISKPFNAITLPDQLREIWKKFLATKKVHSP